MRLLAIDTALAACSAAVLDTEQVGVIASESIPMERGHAEALIPLIGRVMSQAEMEFSTLDRIVVTVGPGSFTGLRVGVAAARGIALAANKPAVGLSTLSAFVAPHISAGESKPLIAVIDARHNHVYMQVFSPDGRTLVQPRIASLDEAVRASMTGPARIVGSAAQMVADAWPAGEPSPSYVEPRAAPAIEWVARLGVVASSSQALPKPLYLRAPDAQPQDAARLPRR